MKMQISTVNRVPIDSWTEIDAILSHVDHDAYYIVWVENEDESWPDRAEKYTNNETALLVAGTDKFVWDGSTYRRNKQWLTHATIVRWPG